MWSFKTKIKIILNEPSDLGLKKIEEVYSPSSRALSRANFMVGMAPKKRNPKNKKLNPRPFPRRFNVESTWCVCRTLLP